MRRSFRLAFCSIMLAVVVLTAATNSAEIMFLLGNEFSPSEGDDAQIAIFEERGDAVDLWDNARLQSDFDALDVADESDLVYIGESISSSRADVLIDTTTPVMIPEQFAFDNWFTTEAPTDHGSPDTPDIFGGSHVGTEIEITNAEHSIIVDVGLTNGSIAQIYEDDGAIDWGFPGAGADIVAIIPGFDDLDPAATIFVYEQGAELIDGSAAPGMRIGFFLSDIAGGGVNEATLLTETGIRIVNELVDYALGIPPETVGGGTALEAGDSDQDLDFDQLDLVKVQIAAKYLTGAAATWGDGDWNAAPGGSQNSPPPGDGQFNQLDIIAALSHGLYLKGPYAALAGTGADGDEQTSLVYNRGTGELSVDAPAGKELTSINITSDGGQFLGEKPATLDGAFDNFDAGNVFKATFGGSFGSISFGNVLPVNLSEAEVTTDLSAVGSLAGGGDLGAVDLVYVPEPTSVVLAFWGILSLCFFAQRHRI